MAPTERTPTRDFDGQGRSRNAVKELPKEGKPGKFVSDCPAVMVDLTGAKPQTTAVTHGSLWLDRSDGIADWERYTTVCY